MKAATLALLLAASPALAQSHLPPGAARDVPTAGVIVLSAAADSILASGSPEEVSLEAFDAGHATGVYLYGSLRGTSKSVGYGRDALGRRYLWLSVQGADSTDHMGMLYDIDLDLRPDFLLLRSVDWRRRSETSTEFRSPAAGDGPFDITIQPACVEPRCDPAGWTVHERVRVEVPGSWFELWRPILGLAAMRGERWLGLPVARLPGAPPRRSP